LKNSSVEKISALSILVGALVVIFYIIPNFIVLEEEFAFISLSPAFFPTLAAWIIAGLAAGRFVLIFIKEKSAPVKRAGEAWLSRDEERNAYKSALVIIAYVLSMKYIGFLVSTPLALAALLVLQDFKKPKRIILISISVALCVYLFFFYVMQVHFPKGRIFE
jgi:hypothetical protein